MRRPNKIEISLVSSVLVLMLMLAALAGKVSALKKALVEKSLPAAEEVVVATNPAPFTAVVATNPASVAVVAASTNPAVAVLILVQTNTVTNTVTMTNWVEVAVPAENYVFSWTLPEGKTINGLSKFGPVPILITQISETNFAFYVISDAKGGKKDVCYHEWTSTNGVKWSGTWEQTSPYFSGICYADKAGSVWIGQFATPTESPMFKIEKRE